ncbi:hypothetical protein A2160_01740 [Candidatus Beckwithbacteria bacterium RBG_13_42_9]|uniref:DUF5667 domain-containing protein n=1 Tax=Candidatus Beckwithbacteria bacterium RBG_13_42_9 TaxID=1797457 RepID=A0A1F5E3L0_9BACT|nr:MAG: hypothetical protein A2160_01740 [Candidatus Beckwithbacteria bacterium RBG_13_42_9]
MKKIIVFSFLTVSLFFFLRMPVLAQENPATPASPVVSDEPGDFVPDPNSPWFGLQNALIHVSQNVQLSLTRDEAKKAELELKFAQQEESLAQKIADSEDPEKFSALLEKTRTRHQELLNKVEARIDKLGDRQEEFQQKVEQHQISFQQKLESKEKRYEKRLQMIDSDDDQESSAAGVFNQERFEKRNEQELNLGQPLNEPKHINSTGTAPAGAEPVRRENRLQPMAPSAKNVQGVQVESSVVERVWNEVVSWFE